MFTLDWYGHEDSEEAGDGGPKCAPVIALDNGNFAAQPNNRIQWFDPAFITPFGEKPDCVTNTRVWRVERETETTRLSSTIRLAPPRGPPKWPFTRRPTLRRRTRAQTQSKNQGERWLRTLTTRAMAAAPGALTLFNGGS
jgi:hypothetical protein